MMGPLAKVRRYVERHGMLAGARGVVVAVSGGPDSIALLDLLVRLTADGPRLHVAHLNHNLRGAASDEDAEFVRRLAESLDLTITMESADVRAAAVTSRRGIEETAREIRHDFLRRVARATGADRIATGHTMNDQAETLLMRLVRGAGMGGLAAMRPVIPAHEFGAAVAGSRGQEAGRREGPAASALAPPIALIRPLLVITRDEVEAYCHERRLIYRVDATNLAGDFTRSRVRRDVLPALEAINPRAVATIARAAEHLAADQDALEALARQVLAASRVASPHDAGEGPGGLLAAFAVADLRARPRGLRRRAVLEAIQQARAAAGSGAGREITAAHVVAVESLLDEGASGKRVHLPGGLAVWREYGQIVFKRAAGGVGALAADDYAFELSAARRQVEAGGWRLMIERGLAAERLPWLVEQARRLSEAGRRDWLMAVLDDAALPEVLTVRPRRRGERARVSGRRQTIKLKKLMIDHTIPVSRRAAWPVVATADDRYVWSPGLPPAVDFAARGETRNLAIVRALNL